MTEHDLASRMQGYAHHLLERLHSRSFRWSKDPILAGKQMAAIEEIEIKEWTSIIREWAEGDAEAMKDERIVVLMRRTEIERRIGEARHGEQA